MDESKTPKASRSGRSGDADRSRSSRSSRSSSSSSSSRRKQRRLTAERLIKLLRKHGTLTLVVCVLAVSLVTGYIAIELGA
jgi:hypothetical protein